MPTSTAPFRQSTRTQHTAVRGKLSAPPGAQSPPSPVHKLLWSVVRRPMSTASTLLYLLALCAATPATAADFKLTPNITVSEELTDNVFESAQDKRYDFITRLLPGLSLDYKAAVVDLSVAYNYDYRYYARNSISGDTTHNLNARSLARIVDEFLFLEVSDVYKRVSLDVSRDTTSESLFRNQSDQNTLTASPYIVISTIPHYLIRGGYRYTNVWYEEKSGIDKTEHRAFADLSYDVTQQFSLTTNYAYTIQDTADVDLDRHEAMAGARYEYAEKSFIFAQGGASFISYRQGDSLTNPVWNAGLTHAFDTFILTLTTGVKYTEDPQRASTEETFYSARLDKPLDRGTLSINASYSDFIDTSIDERVNRRFGVGIALRHDITERLAGNLGFSAERYDQQLKETYTRKFFVDAGLSYQLGEGFSLGLTYKYIDYHSPAIVADNYVVNRGIIEVRKVF